MSLKDFKYKIDDQYPLKLLRKTQTDIFIHMTYFKTKCILE